MATAVSKRTLRLGLSPEKGNEIFGLVLAALMVLLLCSLASYHPLDPSLLQRSSGEEVGTRNLIGPFGAQLADLSFSFLGVVSFLLPLVFGTVAWRRLTGRMAPAVAGRWFGILALALSLPALCQLVFGEIRWRGEPLASGGALGVVFADMLTALLNYGGALLVLLALLAVGVNLILQATLGEVLRGLWRRASAAMQRLRLAFTQRRERRQKEATRRRVVERHARRKVAARSAPEIRQAPGEPVAEEPAEPVRVRTKQGAGHFAVRRVKAGTEAAAGRSRAVKAAPAKVKPAQEELDFGLDAPQGQALPPVSLLRTDLAQSSHNEAELVRRGELIKQACDEFGVAGTIDGISPGPVITVFEFQPAPGVKVSRVVGLQDDLALSLSAESVRIDRMPGRSTLGIEVPNKKRSTIQLGRLIGAEGFKASPSPLTMAIGVDIYGQPVYTDLATMPHLLVAGATGAGKSVGLQSMITSMLYKSTPDEVQFIFIDPKRVELGVYADIPHLKTQVVMDPKKAANALNWAVSEMERRYRLLSEVHVRSIGFYNRAITDPKERERLALGEGESEFNEDDFKPLPNYVVVVDELADLMMVASSEVETAIARLAQMARAVGIHLIIATQRPSVDVLTGTIKANFPCRLAYATTTRHDSRTILDQIGSEKLLGKGDALFMPPGTSRIQRLHGAYISEQETASVIRWLKKSGKPNYDPEVVAPTKEEKAKVGAVGEPGDELYDEAARLVVSEGMASASFLQRRMRVGFSRAARLVDMMEADGLLGPAQGSKPREVLVKPDFYAEMDRAKQGV